MGSYLLKTEKMMKYTKIRDVKSPAKWHPTDTWWDFFIPQEAWLIQVLPWENIKIPLWIKIILPEWYDFTFVNKSWIASKTGLILWACLVDNWYRWELIVNLINTSKWEVRLKGWQKIVQGVIREVNYMLPEEIDNDEYIADVKSEEIWRWEWGFWSTGE